MAYTTDARQDSLIDNHMVFRFTTLWKLARVDGTTFYLTDHDRQITFEGQTYYPSGGFDATAREYRASQAVNNFSSKGILDSSLITTADLQLGLYEEAELTEYVIDWMYPLAKAIRQDTWWLANVRWSKTGWEAELEGVDRFLKRRMGDTHSLLCRHQLGKGICGQVVDIDLLGTYKFSVAVATVVTDKLSFTVASLAAADELMNNGRCDFTSGPLAGLSVDIKTWDLPTKTFVLEIPTPVSFAVGNGATVRAGCNKTETVCKTTFSNYDNFGGRPSIQGTDSILPISV